MGERIGYLDFLRVAAMCAILVLHVAATNFDFVEVGSFAWQVFNAYGGMVRWAVPVFVMISGVLFLNKPISLPKLYSRYVLKMVIVFFFWGIVYCVLQTHTLKLRNILEGHFHLWFILMITGLYICTPVLKEIAAKKSVACYFLALAFVFAYAVPGAILISRDFFNGHFAQTFSSLAKNVSTMNMSVVMGYSSYFVLGKVLHDADFSSSQRKLIYAAGVLGLVLTVALNALCSIKNHQTSQHYFQWISFNVLLESVGVFVFFKYHAPKNGSVQKIVLKLSELSLGVYVVHIFILDLFGKLGLGTLLFNPVFSVPVIAAALFLASLAVSFVISCIPLAKKYII
ncbi:MAG: acyltransferase family protein [Treponema sp.]|nr:acyltransferase family protein [Treponema sp.]